MAIEKYRTSQILGQAARIVSLRCYILSKFNSKETFPPLHTHQLELDYVRNQRDDHGPCHVLVESINPVKATYQVVTAIAQTQAVQQR